MVPQWVKWIETICYHCCDNNLLYSTITSLMYSSSHGVNTLRLRQNGRHFADNIFNCIFSNKNVWISINISLKIVPKGQINNIPAMVQIMAWHRPGDKPLSEPMMVSLLTHICLTLPELRLAVGFIYTMYIYIYIHTYKVSDPMTIAVMVKGSLFWWHRHKQFISLKNSLLTLSASSSHWLWSKTVVGKSSASAMELWQSYAKPSIYISICCNNNNHIIVQTVCTLIYHLFGWNQH